VITFIILIIALAISAQSLFSLYLMLYSWEYPERLAASSGPSAFLSPQLSFSVLLPARHEEAVIYETIKRVWTADYPSDLMEVVVICYADDTGTIAAAQRAIRELGTRCVRVETFATPPINKPHGLNVGFQRTANQVVTIFDAEDDLDANVFNVVNTIMLQEQVGIVQAGVQLMNFRDHWFAIHNCMEYFFWFKSRLHFHAKVGMIPLGGNTVFIRRDLLERVSGWDEYCLTEDADIGLRLSVLGEPIRVVYDAQHVTREETPASVGSFIRQRTRWQQGFLQVLRKGSWRALPHLNQRLLAVYTLSYPFFQALLMLLWPLVLTVILGLKVHVLVAMLSFLPLYALLFQFLTTVVGAFMFTREYGFKFPLLMPMSMALTFLPFQWLLGISAVRVVYRELRQQNNWEKTAHLGAHRQTEVAPSIGPERVLPIAPKQAVTRLAPASSLKQGNTFRLRKPAAFQSAVFKPVPVRPRVASLPNQPHTVAWRRVVLVPIALALLVGISIGTSSSSALMYQNAPTADQLIHRHPLAGLNAKVTSTPAPVSLFAPKLAGRYTGTSYDIPTDLTTSITLAGIQQQQDNFSGYLSGIPGNSSFEGTITSTRIQFTLISDVGQTTFSFDGTIQSDGSIVGTYCGLGVVAGKCSDYGLWTVLPQVGGGSR
jgi:cellulose synthase/poly-beta-1,6-N-acetylglucosamine synthase-like glycosyltransferase